MVMTNIHDQFYSHFDKIPYWYVGKWNMISNCSMEFALQPSNVSKCLFRMVGMYWGNIYIGEFERMQHINEIHIECSLFDVKCFLHRNTLVIKLMISIQWFRWNRMTNVFSFHVLIDELNIWYIIQCSILNMIRFNCLVLNIDIKKSL